MIIPKKLSEVFNEPLTKALYESIQKMGWVENIEDLTQSRFLTRSIKPHMDKLSLLFNRLEIDESEIEEMPTSKKTEKRKLKKRENADDGLKNYWNTTQNKENFLLSYVLGFMPGNAMRVAAIWAELKRVGFEFNFVTKDSQPLKAIEFGAGPGSGALGIGLAESYDSEQIKHPFWNWALIEQDRSILQFATEWVEKAYSTLGLNAQIKPFHRKLEIEKQGFLPRNAPRFHLFLTSYFLNELSLSPKELSKELIQTWDRHMEEESLIILVEPALKIESRKLLELRKELIQRFNEEEKRKKTPSPYKVILPCMGHQTCRALESLSGREDWCHEEVTWWRPSFLKTIDEMCGLDRKTLPFSYLVIAKSKRTREELLPQFKNKKTHRLVSPVHFEGRDLEFYLCGEDGKRKTRLRTEEKLVRGSILVDAELNGDIAATRASSIKKVLL